MIDCRIAHERVNHRTIFPASHIPEMRGGEQIFIGLDNSYKGVSVVKGCSDKYLNVSSKLWIEMNS